ncbi:hypothetical protein SmJEL517_g04098 [Synchytrium microbalum]|uniref:Uncharacterized protein n=1 Tax=Synchytrium microbalum TaxID=1806994 RepID=A0A507C5R3_9FUNG|nr:uncharacterized protein SmJEL517_g04098 [Synchytrium microbalum]TPX32883.1 hypothetical protein SmJEL517_g04098 [Synchytrium microbalum]
MATEYLPPYVSGIANRCKNLIKGYREAGHNVTVYSVAGTQCEHVIWSVPNPFYPAQRMFILPPISLIIQLLDFSTPVPYDIVHVVAPLCWAFTWILPLFKLRGVKVYVSYHVYLEYYKLHYLGDNIVIGWIAEFILMFFYFFNLVFWADIVGIPSKTADYYIYKYSSRIHYMKSGLETSIFKPLAADEMEDPSTTSWTTNKSPPRYSLRSSSNKYAKLAVPPSPNLVPNYNNGNSPTSNDNKFASLPSPLPPSAIIPTTNGTHHHPVTTSIISPHKRSPTLVYVGRLANEKSIDFLIEALEHPKLLNARLVIVGDGPARKSLETRARQIVGPDKVYGRLKPTRRQKKDPSYIEPVAPEPHLPGLDSMRVIFTGMVLSETAIAHFYAHADVFVSASGSETFGFTVAEAMACGTPPVVVRSGAYATAYRIVNEWMYDEGDREDYVGKVIRACEGGKGLRRKSRQMAVHHFSVQAAVKDLLRTYQWVIDGGDPDKTAD